MNPTEESKRFKLVLWSESWYYRPDSEHIFDTKEAALARGERAIEELDCTHYTIEELKRG